MTKNIKDFSIREAIVFGEKQFKKYWFVIIAMLALDIMIETAPLIYSKAIDGFLNYVDGVYIWYTLMAFAFSVLIMIASVIMHFNIVKVFIIAAENKKVDLLHLFEFDNDKILQILKFIIASIIYETIVVIGLILFVIPGIFLAARFAFAIFLIVENNTDIIEAFKQSYRMTDGHTLNLMKFFIAAFVISSAAALVGFALFFVGVIPMMLAVLSILTLSSIHIYRHLQGKAI